MKIITIKQSNVLKVVKTLTLVLSPVSIPAFKLDHIVANELLETLEYLIKEKIVLKFFIQGQVKYWLGSKELPKFLIHEDISDTPCEEKSYLLDILDKLKKVDTELKAKPLSSTVVLPSIKTLDKATGPIELVRNGKSVFKTSESFLVEEAERISRLRPRKVQYN